MGQIAQHARHPLHDLLRVAGWPQPLADLFLLGRRQAAHAQKRVHVVAQAAIRGDAPRRGVQVTQHPQVFQLAHHGAHRGRGNRQAIAVGHRLGPDCLAGGKVLGHDSVQNLLRAGANVAHEHYLTRKPGRGQD